MMLQYEAGNPLPFKMTFLLYTIWLKWNSINLPTFQLNSGKEFGDNVYHAYTTPCSYIHTYCLINELFLMYK